MTDMHTDLPKTINEALKILAYNDYFWQDPIKGPIKPHPKDQQTVRSLAESQYVWTEKQARLALVILKRYLTKFQAHGMDIKLDSMLQSLTRCQQNGQETNTLLNKILASTNSLNSLVSRNEDRRSQSKGSLKHISFSLAI